MWTAEIIPVIDWVSLCERNSKMWLSVSHSAAKALRSDVSGTFSYYWSAPSVTAVPLLSLTHACACHAVTCPLSHPHPSLSLSSLKSGGREEGGWRRATVALVSLLGPPRYQWCNQKGRSHTLAPTHTDRAREGHLVCVHD